MSEYLFTVLFPPVPFTKLFPKQWFVNSGFNSVNNHMHHCVSVLKTPGPTILPGRSGHQRRKRKSLRRWLSMSTEHENHLAEKLKHVSPWPGKFWIQTNLGWSPCFHSPDESHADMGLWASCEPGTLNDGLRLNSCPTADFRVHFGHSRVALRPSTSFLYWSTVESGSILIELEGRVHSRDQVIGSSGTSPGFWPAVEQTLTSPGLHMEPRPLKDLLVLYHLRLTKEAEKPWAGASWDWNTAVKTLPGVVMGRGATFPQLVANRVWLDSWVSAHTWQSQKQDLMRQAFPGQRVDVLGLEHDGHSDAWRPKHNGK